MSRAHGVNHRKVLFTNTHGIELPRFVPCGSCDCGWIRISDLFTSRLARCQCWHKWRDAVIAVTQGARA